MLVLSRQRDETIMIGDEVEVTIVDIRGDKVRLGISAPREVAVHRKEVYDAIKRENHAAAKVRPEDLNATGGGGPGPRLVGGTVAGSAEAADGEQVRPTIRAAGPQAVRPGRGTMRRGGQNANGARRQPGPRPPEGAEPMAPIPALPQERDAEPITPPPSPPEAAVAPPAAPSSDTADDPFRTQTSE